jgi:hypothetical protein
MAFGPFRLLLIRVRRHWPVHPSQEALPIDSELQTHIANGVGGLSQWLGPSANWPRISFLKDEELTASHNQLANTL